MNTNGVTVNKPTQMCICDKCGNKINTIRCVECRKTPGIALKKKDLEQLQEWSVNDLIVLKQTLRANPLSGTGGCGPSSTIAIVLVCYMDIWGSIVKDDFGGDKEDHIGTVLDMLQKLNGALYKYDTGQKSSLTDILRNNLVHNFGRKTFANNNTAYLLDITVNTQGPTISYLPAERRWRIDAYRLLVNMVQLINKIFDKKILNSQTII